MGSRRYKAIPVLLLVAASLTCGPCRPKRHSVTLTWQPPKAAAGTAIVGYNVYRSADPVTGFAKIATRVTAPTYEDYLVTSGHTYFYAVTAIDQQGHESSFSGKAHATVP